jgi:thiol-disulfide isomerase/thioredoxin
MHFMVDMSMEGSCRFSGVADRRMLCGFLSVLNTRNWSRLAAGDFFSSHTINQILMLMVHVRKKLWGALLVAFFCCLQFSGTAFAVQPGASAPDFELPGQQGTVKLSGRSGSVVYLDFWASWCGPCKQSFPWMNALHEKYKAKGLEVIAVNLDAKTEDAKKFLGQNPAKFTVAFDAKGTLPKIYGVKGMPTSFLIGRDGKIVFQHAGFRDADKAKLEQQIQSALEGRK